MNPESNNRRRFIKASLTVPLLSNYPFNYSFANTLSNENFFVPENIYHELFAIYGGDANAIASTDRIKVKTPAIAENGAVVPVRVIGEKGLVSSLAIFITKSPKTLVTRCNFHDGVDLAIGTRIKIRQTDDVYVIAQTKQGLVGVKQTVKVTIGCGGA